MKKRSGLTRLAANTPHLDPPVDGGDSLEALVSNFSAVIGELMSYTTSDWINIDMSMAQIKVVLVLYNLGSHTIQQLAERLQIGAPAVSQLVEKLVQAGYASRRESTSDRRRVDVQLTAQGQALARNLHGPRDQIIAEWFDQLSDEQRLALGDNLKALLHIIANSPRERR